MNFVLFQSTKKQWNPDFLKPKGKRKLIRKLGEIGGSLLWSTGVGKRLLVYVMESSKNLGFESVIQLQLGRSSLLKNNVIREYKK